MPNSPVVMGGVAALNTWVDGQRTLVVTDATVAAAHPQLPQRYPAVVLAPGEAHKTLTSAGAIWEACSRHGLDRHGVIVAVGGGLVCDVAAFAASTWMRGTGLVLVPTTLLAQVDAAIGGKTAVNFAGAKNQIGTFYPPLATIIDPTFLETCPPDLLTAGFAEYLKHALIADAGLFEIIEREFEAPLKINDVAAHLERSIAVKQRIVSADPLESHQRMLLNFGHTVGHAIEASAGLAHGRAVAIGMAAMLRWGTGRGITASDDASRALAVIERFGLPSVHTPESPQHLLDLMARDKKHRGHARQVVVMPTLGSGRVMAVTADDLREIVDAVG